MGSCFLMWIVISDASDVHVKYFKWQCLWAQLLEDENIFKCYIVNKNTWSMVTSPPPILLTLLEILQKKLIGSRL
jgi:hypothetical protein